MKTNADSLINTSEPKGFTEYISLAVASLLSALGWYVVNRWIDPSDTGAKLVSAVLKTMLTLLPAIVAFMIANKNPTPEGPVLLTP